jgi:hypothetical protein
MTPEQINEIAERYSRALSAKPGKGPISPDGIAAITDSVCDIPQLLAEVDRLATDTEVLTALQLDRGQLCDVTGLYPDECGCAEHYIDRPTVISIAALERLANHPLPAYRLKPRDPRWRVPQPERTICNHRKDDLCGACETLVAGLLHDLPQMLEQLGLTLRKAHRFAPRGFHRGDEEHPDESPIPWSVPAVRCMGDLHKLMAQAHLLSRHELLERMSKLMRRGHRVIDRPQDRDVAMCPECRGEIIILNRHRTVTCGAVIVEDDPDAPEPTNGEPRRQRERTCTYAASWEQFRRDLLTSNADVMLTADEIRFVLSHNGEPITRQRISYLATRHGLPREEIQAPKWQKGKIVTEPTWMYRLGDVQDLQTELSRNAAS